MIKLTLLDGGKIYINKNSIICFHKSIINVIIILNCNSNKLVFEVKENIEYINDLIENNVNENIDASSIGNPLLKTWVEEVDFTNVTNSCRLYNSIQLYIKQYGEYILLHEVNKKNFLRIRNVGSKTWSEFEKLKMLNAA